MKETMSEMKKIGVGGGGLPECSPFPTLILKGFFFSGSLKLGINPQRNKTKLTTL